MLPVRELARACVGACALAGSEWGARRAGLARVPEVRVDDGAVATAFHSERHLRVDGRAPETFAPLSRFWRTTDGWVRTHANYPHHRARLLGVLGLPAEASSDTVGGALAERSAVEVEETVCAAGGLAVALRTPEEWAAHEQGRALVARPLVERERLDDAPARTPMPLSGTPLLPMAGLRVLDLTRVVAGPVATRTLALLGADVLRIDSPRLPELPDQHLDMDFGKRSAALDLAVPVDRAAFEELSASADVVVTGYRPGALDRFGLSARALAERRPGLVVAQLSAWGAYGPWGGRRGFDSLVQVATGIAVTEGTADTRPGVLPAQALDHGTGYLLAAAVLRSLTDQTERGGSRVVRLALARTAAWLTSGGTPGDGMPEGRAPGDGAAGAVSTGVPYEDASPWLAEADGGAAGRLRYALSPVRFAGSPATWERAPGTWGADAARWW
ncbi:crotonobetainyl-CoA:carnitine CoA-transferase CaiB-like acyl-CoA transferase [Streptomyces sp. B3I7]|nr:crotonobetainyl-CoA:carnitine CoA-transferase CaiB-like acyl-CoA transferase [Streptomyces sp. B3I7]